MANGKQKPKRNMNINWGKPMPVVGVGTPTRWDILLKRLGITEIEAINHPVAKQWARQHRNSAYIPEEILKAWGLDSAGRD